MSSNIQINCNQCSNPIFPVEMIYQPHGIDAKVQHVFHASCIQQYEKEYLHPFLFRAGACLVCDQENLVADLDLDFSDDNLGTTYSLPGRLNS